MIDPNLRLLESTLECLGPIADEVVLLGGCATGLLLTDAAASPPRATRDVDVIAAITSHVQYHRICRRLRKQGFREDTRDEAIIGRWRNGAIVLDLIPTTPHILGFGNAWYEAAYHDAATATLPSGRPVRHVTAPYFLATKLTAFDDRGNLDFAMSHDIEDLITVLDGRQELVSEVARTKTELRAFLSKRFLELLDWQQFMEAVPGHLNPDAASQARATVVIDRARGIAKLD